MGLFYVILEADIQLMGNENGKNFFSRAGDNESPGYWK